ncbi:MAG: thioredoxin-disulfide reductase [Candidatus Saccharibacteria bacterium]|nr:thioredoxin-disulfide reductase [Candidatus Saccharibacteria bacterium]
MYDIIIVGAGPAGLTAAIYGQRAAKKVLVLEAKSYGGQIINTLDIENYPAEAHVSGFDFATKLYNQAKELGAEIKFEKVLEIRDFGEKKEVETGKEKYTAKTVILTTGSKNRKLGLAGEDELTGKGISYCATCDGAFYKKKKVAVVGGGNTALGDALYLADVAEKVYLIHRRDEFRGEEAVVEQLKKRENVELIYNSQVTKLVSEGKLTGLEVTDKEGKTQKIKVDGLFIAIGRIPENDAFSELIELDAAGYVVAGEDCRTNVPGIFVAGDNRAKEVRQLVTATSDGAVAATAAVKYLRMV